MCFNFSKANRCGMKKQRAHFNISSVIIPMPECLTFFPLHVSTTQHRTPRAFAPLSSPSAFVQLPFPIIHITHIPSPKNINLFPVSTKKVLGVIMHHQFQPHFADPFFFFFKFYFKLLGIKLDFAILFPQIIFASPLKINYTFFIFFIELKGEKYLKIFIIKLITRFNKIIHYESLFNKFDTFNKTVLLHIPLC
jgi:hypothetical protein